MGNILSEILFKVSKYVTIGCIALTPLFFIPTAFGNQVDAQLAFFYVIASIAILTALVALFFDRKKFVIIPFDILSISLFGSVITYFIASLVSKNVHFSLFGDGIDLTSFLSIILFFLMGFIVALHVYKSHSFIRKLLYASFVSSLVIGLIGCISVISKLFSITILYSLADVFLQIPIENLAMYSALFIILAVWITEQIEIPKTYKISLWVIAGLHAFLILMYGDVLALALSAFALICLFIFHYVTKREFSYPAALVLLFMLIIIALQVTFNFGQPLKEHVVKTSVLSFNETTFIISEVLQINPLWGAGPTNFNEQTNALYEQVQLQNSFWNRDVQYGFSFLFTLVASTGIVGAFFWLGIPAGIFFLLILFYNKRIHEDMMVHNIFILSTVMAIMSFIALLFIVPTAPILVLSITSFGVLLGLSHRYAVGPQRIIILQGIFKVVFASLIILLALIVSFMVMMSKDTVIAHVAAAHGTYLHDTQTSSQAAKVWLNYAQQTNPSPVYATKLAAVLQDDLSSLSAIKNAPSQNINALLAETDELYREALLLDSNRYQTYIEIGNYYRFLIEKELAYDPELFYLLAKESYSKAHSLRTNDPVIYFEIAKLELVVKNFPSHMSAITQAYTLQPDYNEVYRYVADFMRTRNNIAGAERFIRQRWKENPDNNELSSLLEELKKEQKSEVY